MSEHAQQLAYLLVSTVNDHTSRCTTAIHMQPKVASIIITSIHIRSAVQAGVLADVLSSTCIDVNG